MDLEFHKLSHAQKRIVNIEKVYSDSSINNICGYALIEGEVNFSTLINSINIFIKENEALRILLFRREGEIFQTIMEYEPKNFEVFNFANEREMLSYFDNLAKIPFKSIFETELYSFGLFKLNNERSGYFVKLHHVISDGWSVNLLSNGIVDIYERLLQKNSSSTSNIKIKNRYLNYLKKETNYLNSKRFLKDKDFWSNSLNDFNPSIDNSQTLYETDAKRIEFILDSQMSSSIRTFIQSNGLNNSTFFISIIKLYYSLAFNNNKKIIGVPVFNRVDHELKETFGMLTSTVPILSKINENNSVINEMYEIQKALFKSYKHQKYPYNLIIKEFSSNNLNNLIDISVNVYNMDLKEEIDGKKIVNKPIFSGQQFYSKQVIVNKINENFVITVDYKSTDYNDFQIKTFVNLIKDLISKITFQPKKELTVKDLELKPLYKLESKQEDFDSNYSLLEIIEKNALLTPESIAIISENGNVSYDELASKVNAFANILLSRGIKQNSRVGLLMHNSTETIVSILAIMKIGAIFIPIDGNSPKERIRFIVKDAKVSLVIINDSKNGWLEMFTPIIHVNLMEINNSIYHKTESVSSKPDDIAYILYTSGSTGNPKGVLVHNKGLLNYIIWASKNYLNSPLDVFAFYSSISFDLTLTSIFAPLVSGSKVAIYSEETNKFILKKIIEDKTANIIKLTPSHLSLLLDMETSNSSLKTFIVGGEQLLTSLASDIYERFDHPNIYNEYGPTETVVGCMTFKFNPKTYVNNYAVPIGEPISNTTIHLLNENLEPTLPGEIGEIFVSGTGVSKGYLNLPEVTQKSFIKRNDKTLYKTGDLARFINGENLEYVGRKDNQVKINGHRIELDEISNNLLKHSNISEVALMQHPSQSIICAFIIGKNTLTNTEVSRYLSEKVPSYMIPRSIMLVDEIPLTHNGKVDKNKLLSLLEIDQFQINYQSENEISKILLSTVKEVLKLNEVTINDNFFLLGGDSIKAMQLTSKLRISGYLLDVRDVILTPLLYDLVHLIKINKKIPSNSSLQNGFIENSPMMDWFLSKEFKEKHYWNQSILIETMKSIELSEYKNAYNKLIKAHDSLRLNLDSQKMKMYFNNAFINGDPSEDGLIYFDYSGKSTEDNIEDIYSICNEIKSKMDVEKDLCFKILIFDFGEQKEKWILFTAHHLLVDGVSWRIILEDFERTLSDPDYNLISFKSDSIKEWNNKVNTVLQNKKSKKAETIDNTILKVEKESYVSTEMNNEKTSSKLDLRQTNSFLATTHLTANEVLLAAFVISLRDSTGKNDISFELETHGRDINGFDYDVSRTVGWFTNMFLAQFYLPKNTCYEKIIYSIKEQIRENYKNAFDNTLEYCMTNNITLANSPIRFNFLGDLDNTFDSKDFKISYRSLGRDKGLSNSLTTSIEFNLFVVNGLLNIEASYDSSKYDITSVLKFIEKFKEQINEIAEYSKMNQTLFTPSDFETVDISEEDLFELIDMN
ncbi:non-ribosomal peptide synthetase [Rossellomorea aquimaris]|uniref:Non-ribosomal peptide synthase protein (TIGR01720 family)/amino acid adenylation domain-containing protein n=1 Tax=Rossellomorea aquimaris TaxID=189382 RepID=A0A366EIF3_9BACI|nr:non-ribosomal peptide synthetase [Rossellomorea aquimaris]RBP02128.1 non-ribosomal peptide synthase protein (TIGR01720 family)/amino acid adenylation domain-containing protein [Rossellomorea aquimaris]